MSAAVQLDHQEQTSVVFLLQFRLHVYGFEIVFLKDWPFYPSLNMLTFWGRVTHICAGKLTSIGSDNGLLPDQRQAIILTNAGILLIGPWGTNLSEIVIEIYTFSSKKMHLKMSSGKLRPICLGQNMLQKSMDLREC